jgi:hypothetical protein
VPSFFSAVAALRRKGKGEDVVEDDMVSVVTAHNGELINCQH